MMSTTARSASSGDAATRRRGDAAKRETPERPVEVINRQKLRTIKRDKIARLSRAVLERIGRQDATLTIAFIREREMRRLNREYRGIDGTTDVLSFAYHETTESLETDSEAGHLGDVVISVETADVYAHDLGLTFDREVEYLIIHGILHLAGYDHETDNGQMNRLENKLRRELIK